MPHTTSVLVIHPNGQTYTSQNRAQRTVDAQRGYWFDSSKTKLIVLSGDDDLRSDGYEYGGKRSYARHLSNRACDLRTRTEIDVPVELRDKTGIPVREPGGASVMQLKPLRDRRTTTGQHTPRHDRLWRPAKQRQRDSNDDNQDVA